MRGRAPPSLPCSPCSWCRSTRSLPCLTTADAWFRPDRISRPSFPQTGKGTSSPGLWSPLQLTALSTMSVFKLCRSSRACATLSAGSRRPGASWGAHSARFMLSVRMARRELNGSIYPRLISYIRLYHATSRYNWRRRSICARFCSRSCPTFRTCQARASPSFAPVAWNTLCSAL